MSEDDRCAGLYRAASTEFERAAGHCKEAAKHSELGEHSKAAQHAFISYGHRLNAEDKTREAAMLEAENYSEDVMGSHPVTNAPDEYPS